jgi:hypothetical protein
MPRIRDNPDRNFSADPVDKSEAEVLRRLIDRSEVADLLDEAIRERVGRAIARAVFDPAKPGWWDPVANLVACVFFLTDKRTGNVSARSRQRRLLQLGQISYAVVN